MRCVLLGVLLMACSSSASLRHGDAGIDAPDDSASAAAAGTGGSGGSGNTAGVFGTGGTGGDAATGGATAGTGGTGGLPAEASAGASGTGGVTGTGGSVAGAGGAAGSEDCGPATTSCSPSFCSSFGGTKSPCCCHGVCGTYQPGPICVPNPSGDL